MQGDELKEFQSRCEHDPRVDPFNMYSTDPPKFRVICVKCGLEEHKTVGLPDPPDPYRPYTWPKFEGTFGNGQDA
jgi:hypothetical protein